MIEDRALVDAAIRDAAILAAERRCALGLAGHKGAMGAAAEEAIRLTREVTEPQKGPSPAWPWVLIGFVIAALTVTRWWVS